MILITPKLSPINTQLLSAMEYEGEETPGFNFLVGGKFCLFIVIRGYSRSSNYITDAKGCS